jgi:outer membrane murein-binding lipoprotein Lpp
MANSAQLHNDAEQLRQKIKVKRDDANKANLRAEESNRAGNFEKAAVENELANKNQQEALPMEQTAVEYDRRAAELEGKAVEIEKQQNRLQTNTQAQIDKLEQQKKALRGNS